LLVLSQVDAESGKPDPGAEMTWQAIRLQGNAPLAVGAPTGPARAATTATGAPAAPSHPEGAARSTEAGPAVALPRRFHGSVALAPTRVGRDAGQIAQEVIAHLAGLPGAEVRVTLEIEAE
jgi:hypothetical protein